MPMFQFGLQPVHTGRRLRGLLRWGAVFAGTLTVGMIDAFGSLS